MSQDHANLPFRSRGIEGEIRLFDQGKSSGGDKIAPQNLVFFAPALRTDSDLRLSAEYDFRHYRFCFVGASGLNSAQNRRRSQTDRRAHQFAPGYPIPERRPRPCRRTPENSKRSAESGRTSSSFVFGSARSARDVIHRPPGQSTARRNSDYC